MGARERGKATASSVNYELKQNWSEWTDLVEDIARRRKRAYRLTDRKYAELHRKLLVQIQQQVDKCKSARYTLVREMQALAAPWNNLNALANAERHALGVLLAECRRLERRLGHHSRRGQWKKVAIPLLIALVAGVGFTLLMQHWDSFNLSYTLRHWQHRAYRLERSVVGASFQTKMAVLAVIVLSAGTFFLRKMRED